MKRATEDVDNCPNNMKISIHALVKRATVHRLVAKAFLDISIHALVKRATLQRLAKI